MSMKMYPRDTRIEFVDIDEPTFDALRQHCGPTGEPPRRVTLTVEAILTSMSAGYDIVHPTRIVRTAEVVVVNVEMKD